MQGVNLVAELRLSRKEVMLTRVLRLLVERTAFGRKFIELLVGESDADDVAALEEVSLTGYGRIDLLVTWRTARGQRCLVLEHKIEAGEGERQTERYFEAADVVHAHVLRTRGWTSCERPRYAMLALSRWANPKHSEFQFVQHQALIPLLDAVAKSSSDPAITALATGWADELRQYYNAAKSADFWSAAEGETPGGLATGFSVLEELATELSKSLPVPLQVQEVYRGAGSGHSWLAAKMAQPNWRYAIGGLTADVHFQLALDSADRSASLTLNHEVFPYRTRADALAEFGAILEPYCTRRAAFVDAVRPALRDRAWSIRGEWNQVARARPVNAENKQLLLEGLAEQLAPAAQVVSAALDAESNSRQ